MIAKFDNGLTDVEKLLDRVTVMVDALEYYLIEGEIYRTVVTPVTHGYDRFTMSAGELLSLLHDLEAQRPQLLQEQCRRIDEIWRKTNAVTQQLSTRYSQLLEREIIARLDSLNWFLNDCRDDRQLCRDNYRSEIRNRQCVEEILQAWGTEMPRRLSDRVERIDERVRQMTETASFIWSHKPEERFPKNPYWYLYELPKANV